MQRHIYAVTFLAFAIGAGASAGGQQLIRQIVESNPDIRLVNGVPLILIAGAVAVAIVVELFGGVIFDFDVRAYYYLITYATARAVDARGRSVADTADSAADVRARALADDGARRRAST
jgi:hypothetical protein